MAHRPRFFIREPDGSPRRLRIRLDPDLAALIEEAAGGDDLLDWMLNRLWDAASSEVDELRLRQPAVGPPPLGGHS